MQETERPTPSPEVSICIPTFNGAAFIEDTLAPLLDCDPARVEIVVSDHGSTDGTTDLIERVGRGRVRLVEGVMGREASVGSNWMQAVNAARGVYLKVLCQDDRVTSDLIIRQAEALRDSPSAAMCFSPVDVISNKGRVIMRRSRMGRDLNSDYELVTELARLGTNPVGEPAGVMFRRAAIPPDFAPIWHFMLDLEFYLEAMKSGPAVFLDVSGAGFRVSASSWSRALRRQQASEAQAMIDRELGRLGMSGLSRRARCRIRTGGVARRMISALGARC
jgi:glycosyltransferase involved in cell wall biosynthesis